MKRKVLVYYHEEGCLGDEVFASWAEADAFAEGCSRGRLSAYVLPEDSESLLFRIRANWLWDQEFKKAWEDYITG